MNNHLPTDYQAFIHKSRYARWLDKEGRRETWSETVSRYMENIVHPVAGVDTYIKEIEDETNENAAADRGIVDKIEREDSRTNEIGVHSIQYERLSEFFFDLCLSWC